MKFVCAHFVQDTDWSIYPNLFLLLIMLIGICYPGCDFRIVCKDCCFPKSFAWSIVGLFILLDCVVLTNPLADDCVSSKTGNWMNTHQPQEAPIIFASHPWLTEITQPPPPSPQQHPSNPSDLQFMSQLTSEIFTHPQDNLTTEQAPVCLLSNLHLQVS